MKATPVQVINALTIDVEEYYHGLEFEAAVAEGRTQLPSRVEESVERVLRILGTTHTRGTFFVLGCVAREHPGMVRRIATAGHEVACHGDAHELVSRQTPAEFRADIHRARRSLEDIVGEAVIGYRAPNYSITARTPWAFDILLDEGFRYDSSVYPIHHDRYGFPRAPRFPHLLRDGDNGPLWEFPLATVRLLGLNLPIGGGGIFRLFPYHVFRAGIRRVNRRDGQGVVFYFHPWELDPGQPRPPMPLMHRFRHYAKLHRAEAKIARLLSEVRFAPIREVMAPRLNATPTAEARG